MRAQQSFFYCHTSLSYLVVHHIWVWRRVQSVDGVQDIVSQIAQVHYGIGHHSFGASGPGQQQWNRCVLLSGDLFTDVLIDDRTHVDIIHTCASKHISTHYLMSNI